MPTELSPYRKAMKKDRERRTQKNKTPNQRQREAVGACDAKKKDGTRCRNPKGAGTEHYGFGPCRYHGGNTRNHKANAAKAKAILMGAPIDINPLDALIWCIKLTAGEVQFCTQQMEILEQEEWLEHTMIGKQLHIWAKERQKAVDRLAKFSKDALALGIAERAVRLAEQYGTSIARYTKGLLEDLNLTAEQKKQAPLIVRKHLALLEGGGPITDEDRRATPELARPAIPKRVSS